MQTLPEAESEKMRLVLSSEARYVLSALRDILFRLVDVTEILMGVPPHHTMRAIRKAWRNRFRATCPKCGHKFARLDRIDAKKQ